MRIKVVIQNASINISLLAVKEFNIYSEKPNLSRTEMTRISLVFNGNKASSTFKQHCLYKIYGNFFIPFF